MPDSTTKPAPVPKQIGVRVTKDAIISTRCGLIILEAFKPIKDPAIVAQVKASGLKTEPVYQD